MTENDKREAIEKLIHGSSPRPDFFLMIIMSVAVASFGLFLENPAIVIGSMLIAPILLPVLSISLGLVMSDFKLLARSLYTVGKSIVLGVLSAAVITFFFYDGTADVFSDVLLPGNAPLIYFMVSVVSGITVAFALVKPDLNTMMPGAAVAVTLIPPLAGIGIGVATLDGVIIRDGGLLLILNLFGVIASSLVVFSLMNLYIERYVAKQAVKKEDLTEALSQAAQDNENT